MNKVSVILTSYNHAKFLKQSIESVLNQSFSDFELIIWDDGSTDNSWEIIQGYKDPRIKSYRNEKNLRGSNTNRALQVAKGEYIAVHHSDDFWEVDKLEKQVSFLDSHPEIGAVFTRVNIITENGETLTDKNEPYYGIFDRPNKTRFEWLNFFFNEGNALCHPSVLIRRECYENCGQYRYGIAQLPDLDLWIRVCLRYDIHILPEKLINFRVRKNFQNSSALTPDVKTRIRFEKYHLYENYRQIDSKEMFLAVFPEAISWFTQDEYDLEFILAMLSIEECQPNMKKLFGLNLIFEALNNPVRAELIERVYQFTYQDFLKLTAMMNIFPVEFGNNCIGIMKTLNDLYHAIKERLSRKK